MVKINLKGVAKVTAKGKVYWYAWRGGPRLRGLPDSPEFIASFNEAIVAVGTAIARRPPHRSQRAALPHWAPTLGHDAKPHVGEWMS
jgi:hypothetical protein